MMRTATRKAIGGARDSRSSAQAAFMAWELPSTSPTRVTAKTRNAMLIHSRRMARRSASACLSGNEVRPKLIAVIAGPG